MDASNSGRSTTGTVNINLGAWAHCFFDSNRIKTMGWSSWKGAEDIEFISQEQNAVRNAEKKAMQETKCFRYEERISYTVERLKGLKISVTKRRMEVKLEWNRGGDRHKEK